MFKMCFTVSVCSPPDVSHKVSNVIFGKLRSVRELPKLRKLFAITILAVTYPFLTVAYLLAPCSEVSHPTNGTGSRFQRVKQCKRDYTLLEGAHINRAFQNSFQLILCTEICKLWPGASYNRISCRRDMCSTFFEKVSWINQMFPWRILILLLFI